MARILGSLPYQEAGIPLRSGDRVVLFTDGVSEAMSPSGEIFGETRLEDLIRDSSTLTAGDLVELVSRAVLELADGNLEDDLTVVIAAIE